MGKLTALAVKRLVTPGRHGDGDGLWLQVRDAEHRSWLFRFKLHGRAREMGLGALSDMPLVEARDAAAACRRLVRDGIDPIDHRDAARAAAKAKAQSQANTFREVATRYIESHAAGWRNPKHVAQWTATLTTYAYPMFGDRSVAAIDTALVLKALEPIWREKSETASRLRGRIQSVLDYATAQGWRTGDNPARWRGHLSNLLPAARDVTKVVHHPALPLAELPALMAQLITKTGTAPLALRFVILTACRTGEAIGARWQEIEGDTWTVPAERMKAGREHRVPLSAPALAILAEMHPLKASPADFVFPGPGKAGHLSNMALTALLRRMKLDTITVHGFRSTFRDWAAEVTAYSREVAEMALAHSLKDKTEAAYRRGDLLEKRKAMMTEWAAFCGSAKRHVP
ncbi:MAG: tyrosine-type recombinase/integrase [Janthinobacterium lividum]